MALSHLYPLFPQIATVMTCLAWRIFIRKKVEKLHLSTRKLPLACNQQDIMSGQEYTIEDPLDRQPLRQIRRLKQQQRKGFVGTWKALVDLPLRQQDLPPVIQQGNCHHHHHGHPSEICRARKLSSDLSQRCS